MIQSEQDYSEEIANLCRQHNVKYLGLHGSCYDQENIGAEKPDITFLVEFFPMETKEYGKCYLGLEKGLQDLFSPNAGILDLGSINIPDMVQRFTKRTTDIYKATEPPKGV
ncbi:hypothetical protein ACFL3Q_07760 [Planctomycetota bacterium]